MAGGGEARADQIRNQIADADAPVKIPINGSAAVVKYFFGKEQTNICAFIYIRVMDLDGHWDSKREFFFEKKGGVSLGQAIVHMNKIEGKIKISSQ